MIIRPYVESDEQDVATLWREVFPDAPEWNQPEADIRRKLSTQRDLFLVAVIDSELVGTTMAGFDGHRGWVYYVVVCKTFRRQGVATALMRHAESGLAKLGCSKVNLQIRASNHEAVSFYERLGYRIEERVSMGKRLRLNVTE